MRRYLMAVILLSGAVGCTPAPPDEANRLFGLSVERAEAGDYRGSAAALEAVLESGWTTAELLLNLAHVYAEAGDLGRARLYAERAERLAPRRSEVRATQARIARLAGDPPPRAPTLTEALAARLARGIGSATLLGLGAALWLGVTIGIAVLLWFRPRGTVERVGLALGGVGVVLLLALAALTARYEHRAESVVITESALLSAPGGTEVGRLGAGRLLRRGTIAGSWQRVPLSDGTEAWIAREQVEDV